MVKLSLVVGILALAASANAACDSTTIAKCASDMQTAAAGGDMCSAIAGAEKCYGDLTDCGMLQAAVDAAVAGLAQSKAAVGCGGSSGGGESSGCTTTAIAKCASDMAAAAAGGDMCSAITGAGKCYDALPGCEGAMKTAVDAAKAGLEQSAKAAGCSGGGSSSGGGSGGCSQSDKDACGAPVMALASLMSSSSWSMDSFNSVCGTGMTAVDTAVLCYKTKGCTMTAEETKGMEDFKKGLTTYCEVGPSSDMVKNDAKVKTCLGDADTDTCEGLKKYIACGPKDAIGTTAITQCTAKAKEIGSCDPGCPTTASTGVKPSSVNQSTDTGAASSTQVSAAVLVAAVAFVGMAN